MGVSVRPHGAQGSGAASEYLLEVPFEAYTDSPGSEDNLHKDNVRVNAIPRGHHVGRLYSSAWHRALAILVPSFASRRKNQGDDGDENEDEDTALPLLSENPPQRKRSRRSCWPRCFVRSLIGFFVML